MECQPVLEKLLNVFKEHDWCQNDFNKLLPGKF